MSSHQPQETYIVASARDYHLRHLPAIEQSAGTVFAQFSDPALAELANDDPMSTEQHQEYLDKWRKDTGLSRTGGTFVAWTILSEEHVGFIVTSLVPVTQSPPKVPSLQDSAPCYFVHIHELSVHSDHQRKGLAGRLVQRVKDCVAQLCEPGCGNPGSDEKMNVVAVTLTTMRDVPFNAPFYAKHGFEEIAVDKIGAMFGSGASTIWEEHDQEHFRNVGDGSLATRRCFMAWHVPST